MRFINIKPCENTFFGDGNQYNFGINNFIKSKNTPYPSVFFGAIYTAILSKNDSFRKEFFSKVRYDHEKILKLHQMYLYNNITQMAYIPAPKDLFVNSEGKKAFGKFEENNKVCSVNYKRILQSPEDSDYKMVSNKYINIEDIKDLYAKKISDQIELVDENKIFIKNNKIGIKIDKNTKSVEESMLYKAEQTEFLDDIKGNNNWSYLVEYEIVYDYLNDNYNGINVKDIDSGYLKLGGENKVCVFKTMQDDYIKDFFVKERMDEEGVKLNKGIYKVILTSDSFFKEDIRNSFGASIKVLGVANDKPIYIGGFDMKYGTRKMYKGYSAGTVVLIKVLDDMGLRLNDQNSKGFNQYIVLKES